MKRVALLMFVAVLAVTGCAKKVVEVPAAEKAARQSLIEGTVYLKQGDPVKAIQSFVSAIKVAPDYSESYFLLGETFIRLKQFPQAVAVLSAAARQFPNNGLAYYLLAVSSEGAGQPLQAIVAARRSVELFEAQGDKESGQKALILLGSLVSQAKKDSEAKMVENAAMDAQKAVEGREAPVVPAIK